MRAPAKPTIEANSRLCDEEWRDKKVTLLSKPRVLTIETTQYCNLTCVMCPHGLDNHETQPRHFPKELTPKLREVIEYASTIQLHGIGEPIMNPAFWDMLEMPMRINM